MFSQPATVFRLRVVTTKFIFDGVNIGSDFLLSENQLLGFISNI